jgi:hypothetical protein
VLEDVVEPRSETSIASEVVQSDTDEVSDIDEIKDLLGHLHLGKALVLVLSVARKYANGRRCEVGSPVFPCPHESADASDAYQVFTHTTCRECRPSEDGISIALVYNSSREARRLSR